MVKRQKTTNLQQKSTKFEAIFNKFAAAETRCVQYSDYKTDFPRQFEIRPSRQIGGHDHSQLELPTTISADLAGGGGNILQEVDIMVWWKIESKLRWRLSEPQS